jgi:hypothetical protein
MPDHLSHDQCRLNQTVERRLRSASAELRAMAVAVDAGWEPPDFPVDSAQEEAIFSFLRACDDARNAIVPGHAADAVEEYDPAEMDTTAKQRAASERLILLDRAIAAGNSAERRLRQRGLRAIVEIRERTDIDSEQGDLARADLIFCQHFDDEGAER